MQQESYFKIRICLVKLTSQNNLLVIDIMLLYYCNTFKTLNVWVQLSVILWQNGLRHGSNGKCYILVVLFCCRNLQESQLRCTFCIPLYFRIFVFSPTIYLMFNWICLTRFEITDVICFFWQNFCARVYFLGQKSEIFN